jgi:hypothetical protein
LGASACGLNGRGHLEDSCALGQWITTTSCQDPDECSDGASESRRRYQAAAVPSDQACQAEDQT